MSTNGLKLGAAKDLEIHLLNKSKMFIELQMFNSLPQPVFHKDKIV